jgi:hypothetical protein
MLSQPSPLFVFAVPRVPWKPRSRSGDQATGCPARKQAKRPCGYVRTFLDTFRWHCHCNQEGFRSR